MTRVITPAEIYDLLRRIEARMDAQDKILLKLLSIADQIQFLYDLKRKEEELKNEEEKRKANRTWWQKWTDL